MAAVSLTFVVSAPCPALSPRMQLKGLDRSPPSTSCIGASSIGERAQQLVARHAPALLHFHFHDFFFFFLIIVIFHINFDA